MWPSDRKQRITKMTTKIVRLLSLASLLWDYLSRSVYSKKSMTWTTCSFTYLQPALQEIDMLKRVCGDSLG
jgi:hypothetical protein